MKAKYFAVVHQDHAQGPFGVSFPDVPGCIASGDTMDEALSSAAEALTHHLQVCLDYGDPIPKSGPLVSASEIEPKGLVGVAIVEAELPSAIKRVNITIAENLLAEIDGIASDRGMSRSAFLAEGARRLMEQI